jgi:cytidine deaminase
VNLFEELKALLENAWAPYSNFRVASIAVSREGRRFAGVNVESAAYPTTMCAERNALFHAVAQGCRPGDIAEVHILAHDGSGLCEAFPCGSCRQVIAELSRNGADIHIYAPDGSVERHTIAELLPHAFTL